MNTRPPLTPPGSGRTKYFDLELIEKFLPFQGRLGGGFYV